MLRFHLAQYVLLIDAIILTVILAAGSFTEGFADMADADEAFVLSATPNESESNGLQDDNKQESQLGTSSKSPSSQTTYTQQVRTMLKHEIYDLTQKKHQIYEPNTDLKANLTSRLV